eukprot:5719587-Prymnesium_polylepis.2
MPLGGSLALAMAIARPIGARAARAMRTRPRRRAAVATQALRATVANSWTPDCVPLPLIAILIEKHDLH